MTGVAAATGSLWALSPRHGLGRHSPAVNPQLRAHTGQGSCPSSKHDTGTSTRTCRIQEHRDLHGWNIPAEQALLRATGQQWLCSSNTHRDCFLKQVTLHWASGSNNRVIKIYKWPWIFSRIFPLGLIVSSVIVIKQPQRENHLCN